jgi:Cu/Ag efflux protein CusF
MVRRREITCLLGCLIVLTSTQLLAQPSANDLIAAVVVKINAEEGTVTLRHESIAHLHLPATTTRFRYIDPRLVLRIRDGDRIRFRADRYDGMLRLTAVVPLGAPTGP